MLLERETKKIKEQLKLRKLWCGPKKFNNEKINNSEEEKLMRINAKR